MDKTNMSGAVHDLEVMGLIPGWAKLWVHSTSVLSDLNQKIQQTLKPRGWGVCFEIKIRRCVPLGNYCFISYIL